MKVQEAYAIKTESRLVVLRVWEEVGMGNYGLVGTEFQFGKTKRVLEMDGGDGCTAS